VCQSILSESLRLHPFSGEFFAKSQLGRLFGCQWLVVRGQFSKRCGLELIYTSTITYRQPQSKSGYIWALLKCLPTS
jgi:hypothetical protein